MNKNPGTPGNPLPRNNQMQDVTIYWIGDFMLQRDKDGNLIDTDVSIGSDGLGAGMYVMPKIGGGLTVPANVAKALVENGRWPYPKGHIEFQKSMREAFTYDKEYAKMKAESFYSGKSMEALVAAKNINELSLDELEAAVARKKKEAEKAAAKEAKEAAKAEKKETE
jgi:hypothetical protein